MQSPVQCRRTRGSAEMPISPLAGKPAPKEMLVDPARLEREYYERKPDLDDPGQLVSFGTSGHRGSPLRGSFTEAHILAITQAICDYRHSQSTDGPLYMGKDTHAVSGPAHTDVTQWVENRANELLRNGNTRVKRVGFTTAFSADTTHQEDFVLPYVNDLRNVVDMEAIRAADLKLAVDPLGGAAVHYWEPINAIYKLHITVVNPKVDPTFSFMTVDHDGKIRMDCSSPYAMAGLVGLKDRYRVAFANDADADRHGIVTPAAGLMNPNHYLSVAIAYLLTHRPDWPVVAAVGKTLVSSGLIDRVVKDLGRKLTEVPVGFKWFAPGLFDGSFCFGGEESAGASFLRKDGTVWTTDKDGLLLGLLAAEIPARTGKDPGEQYRALAEQFGTPHYTRIDAPATLE